MTGRLQVCEPQSEILKHTHAISEAGLGQGTALRRSPPLRPPERRRQWRFRRPRHRAAGSRPRPFPRLVSRPQDPHQERSAESKTLRGVGNIYADESLFRAGIRPRRRASTITRDQFAKLLTSIKEVLREAIALGGSSISDYVDADGEEGFFQLQHRVYGREGEPCLVCKTPIKRIVIAGRSSHYCPKCQK